MKGSTLYELIVTKDGVEVVHWPVSSLGVCLNLEVRGDGVDEEALLGQVQENCPLEEVVRFMTGGSELEMSIYRKLNNVRRVILKEPTLPGLDLLSAQERLEDLELYEFPDQFSFSRLSSLKNLKELEISPCLHSYKPNFSRSKNARISLTDIHVLSKLEKLTLRGMELENFGEVQKIAHLKELDVRSSIIENFGLKIVKLREIETLIMSEVADFEFVQLLPALRSLSNSHSPAESADFLGKLKELRCLRIPFARIRGFEFLKELVRLQELDLEQTQIVDLSPLAGCLELERLMIAKTKVKDLSPIRNCKLLELLYMERTMVEKLDPLLGTSLKTLWLTKANVDNDSQRKISEVFPMLEMLDY